MAMNVRPSLIWILPLANDYTGLLRKPQINLPRTTCMAIPLSRLLQNLAHTRKVARSVKTVFIWVWRFARCQYLESHNIESSPSICHGSGQRGHTRLLIGLRQYFGWSQPCISFIRLVVHSSYSSSVKTTNVKIFQEGFHTEAYRTTRSLENRLVLIVII